MIEVIIDRDYAEVLGKRIQRPSSVAPGQWLEFWQPLDGGHQEQLDLTNGKKKSCFSPLRKRLNTCKAAMFALPLNRM